MNNETLVQKLIESGVLRTPRIIEAFRAIDRKDFVARGYLPEAYNDTPLPIGYDQTISQPTTVAFMLELLGPRPKDIVMDIGSGSGWTTALLSHIVGKEGRVYAIELIPELKAFGEKNAARYNFVEKGIAVFLAQSAEEGLGSKAPFDRILTGAAADELPKAWKAQLKAGGRIVAPLQNSIWLFIKNEGGSCVEKEYPGFAFVPFITK